jgi:polar amino acid transport system substrate-binding protein
MTPTSNPRKRHRARAALAAATAVIAVAALSACTSSNDSGSGGSSSNSTLKEVLKSKELKVGIFQSAPPFATIDLDGNPKGYDVDLANQLAKSLGAKVKFVTVTPGNRIAQVQTGKIDVLLTEPAITTERAQIIAYTQPYSVAGTTVITKASSGITSMDQLNGKQLAYVTGEFYGPIAKKYLPKASTRQFQQQSDELTALKNGTIDGYFLDSRMAAFAAAQDSSLKVVQGNFGPLEYDAMAVRQGDPTWLGFLNTFILTTQFDGSSVALYKKWFGAEPAYSPILTKPATY